ERPATEFVAGFIGVSNILDRDGRRFTVRPEKVHLLLEGDEAPPAGAHVESGEIAEVTYLGVLTRYVVTPENRDRLAAVRQNRETAAAATIDETARRVRVAWRPEHEYDISPSPQPEEKR